MGQQMERAMLLPPSLLLLCRCCCRDHLLLPLSPSATAAAAAAAASSTAFQWWCQPANPWKAFHVPRVVMPGTAVPTDKRIFLTCSSLSLSVFRSFSFSLCLSLLYVFLRVFSIALPCFHADTCFRCA